MIERYLAAHEVSLRMKEQGFPQETVFQWVGGIGTSGLVETQIANMLDPEIEKTAAPMAEEILDQLPRYVHAHDARADARADLVVTWKPVVFDQDMFHAMYWDGQTPIAKGSARAARLSNALGELWLWTESEGLLRPPTGEEDEL